MAATLDRGNVLEREPGRLGGVPDWFNASRQAGWMRFQELPMPSRKDEEWRFAGLRHLDFEGVQLPDPQSMGTHRGASGLEKRAARIGFFNEGLNEQELNLPEGVICLPLRLALEEHSDLVQEYFMKSEHQLGSAKFAALHQAHVSSGIFIYVPDGVVVEDPIEIFHWLAGDHVITFPHSLVVTGRNARVTVVDYFQSDTSARNAWTIAVNDLVAGPGSQLTYLALQDLCDQARMIQVGNTTVARDATSKSFILNAGAAWARQESRSCLEGENAHSDMLSVSIARDEQEYDQRTFQHHASARSCSDLLYKNTLYDGSRTVFSGLILVDDGAHQTDAYQTCRNLLMSEAAEASSMPGLEIKADQVKCSHGSTSAMIDDDEIFYLRARGIKPHIARQLVAQGFSVESISRLKNKVLEDLVLGFAAREFHRISERVVVR
ncbi:MAG TPA: Fe-S cluster assembly protein SufD [Verrucomicrobiales bacterium]|nr:Fe-S cluster assembly protein SufD [Verrucomicrobiales bacterium]